MFFEELFDYKLSLNLHLTLRQYFSGLRPYLLNFQTPLPMLFHKLIFDFYATYLPHPCPVLSLYIQNHMNMKRSEDHTSELQSRGHLVCRLLLEKKNNITS